MESRRSVMVNVLDCDIVVSILKLPSRYYIYFRILTSGKGMNPHIPSQL